MALAIEGSTGTINFAAEDLNWYRRVGSPEGSLSVNQTPASKQLAINHVDASNDIDNTKHNELITALNTLGYPQGDGNQTFKMIAVSNGSECAQPQPVGSGGSLLNYTGTISTTFLTSILANVGFATLGAFTGGVSFSAFSFPPLIAMGTIPGTDHFNIELKVNAKANNVGNEVYKGKINYIKKVMTVIPVAVPITNRSYNASAGTLAYDYFPGGSQDLVSDLPLPEPGNDYFLERNIVFNHQPYCHVPIPSALDIGQGAVALTFADYFMPYQGAVPPTGSKSSAFPAFITAFNISGPDNEGHTQISRRNGDWLAAELNGTGTLSPNCAFACNGGTISGDATFCTTSGNYSIPNLPAGATVVWTISPPRAVTINSPNATQTTLTKVNNGPITLTATISSDCGANVVIQKEIYVGPEPVNVLGAFDPTYHTIMGEVCVGDPYYFVAGDPVSSNPLNTYTWTHTTTGLPQFY